MNTQYLKEELHEWQEHYSDPADKSNYDFFTALTAAVERLEAAERERDELRLDVELGMQLIKRMERQVLDYQAEIARRDAAASEPVGLQCMGDSGKWQDCASREVAESLGFTQFRELYTAAQPAVLLQSDIDRIVPAIDPNGLDEARHYIEHALYVDRERIRSELKELGAQPAVLPYLSDDTLREMVSAYNIANHSSEAYEEMRAAMDRGAQQQPQKVVVVLPAPERHREPGIIVGMYESFVVYKALDEAGVKWEVKK